MQERAVSAVSKSVLKHNPTNDYLLNIYSIHNYQYLDAVVPETLRSRPLRVTNINIEEVRHTATQHMRLVKAMNTAGDADKPDATQSAVAPAPSSSDVTAVNVGTASAVPTPHTSDVQPAFEQKKAKATRKITKTRGQKSAKETRTKKGQPMTTPTATLTSDPEATTSTMAVDDAQPSGWQKHRANNINIARELAGSAMEPSFPESARPSPADMDLAERLIVLQRKPKFHELTLASHPDVDADELHCKAPQSTKLFNPNSDPILMRRPAEPELAPEAHGSLHVPRITAQRRDPSQNQRLYDHRKDDPVQSRSRLPIIQ
ncbi:hypothetical protein CONPUDRAFT_160762 [Coniophora puteana RWD-64-598 SS2]|uniref:Uncharacterized protein n=1 Tax=Coniophora puteana (strain RWD-64-598) TaxID=741705 RepID=R7SC51_CONPW|nr:uncharacterized protein CONPUDRAFT_160762 [Coniophora puteana RWD-64-598 SS2]EIW73746.1 hypothetical protein CONPUDRAFT_160762 [Coniophora puteana RWD-64-598 SS2]